MNVEKKQYEKRDKRKPAMDIANMAYGKVPPQAKDMEKAVLGAIMLEPRALDICAELLVSDCFYVGAHQLIFKAMCSLSQRNMPVDMLTVVEELQRAEDLDKVGGIYAITELTKSVISSANIETHARIILQKFIQRELIRISGETINDAYEDSTDVFDLLDEVDSKMTTLTTGHLKKSYTHLPTAIAKSLTRIEELKALGQSITGVPSGFTGIDALTHGWQPGDLIILAARPSVGKTALALNIARNAASNKIKQVPVAFFSMEMAEEQLTNRLLASESGVFLDKISTGNISDEWLKTLYTAGAEPLAKLKIFIDDSPGLTIMELNGKVRNLVRKEKVELVVIDYLQLMSGDSKGGNREREISTISRGLKTLAKKLKIPIIALSQLSRETEKRKGEEKMPQLSDLRESGAIEQDADVVMFLYRPDYYDITANEMGESTAGKTIVRIAKNRSGKLGKIDLKARLDIQKFEDLDGLDEVKASFGGGTWTPVSSIHSAKDDEAPF